jgi:hypothetical protein
MTMEPGDLLITQYMSYCPICGYGYVDDYNTRYEDIVILGTQCGCIDGESDDDRGYTHTWRIYLNTPEEQELLLKLADEVGPSIYRIR